MPFKNETFDGAYAIEATCHAPTLEQVYSEVYRCLKPGSVFVAYEWVTTPNYDDKNEAHVAIGDEIIIGNGLPNLQELEGRRGGRQERRLHPAREPGLGRPGRRLPHPLVVPPLHQPPAVQAQGEVQPHARDHRRVLARSPPRA